MTTAVFVLFYLAIACLGVAVGKPLGWVSLVFATVGMLVVLVPGFH